MQSKFRILHCLRAPVGGLFRHVLDLASEQAELGHDVGIVADATSSDALTKSKLAAIAPNLALGVDLIPMSRKPGIGDVGAARALVRRAHDKDVNVLHGHGAKGGAYARIGARVLRSRRQQVACFYTPHGGSLHFNPKSVEGRIYLWLEKVLAGMTDGIIFESTFAHDTYADHIGLRNRPVKVIPNGLKPSDFGVHQPAPDAADFLFVGELRHLKGVDVMLKALAALNKHREVHARFVGAGPDTKLVQSLAHDLEITRFTSFPGPQPAIEAFPSGRCLIVPSRAESFPYIVLEAGAQQMPIIATDVGGIPEMAAGTSLNLIEADNVNALKKTMLGFLETPDLFCDSAKAFKAKVETTYTVSQMTRAVLNFYDTAANSTG